MKITKNMRGYRRIKNRRLKRKVPRKTKAIKRIESKKIQCVLSDAAEDATRVIKEYDRLYGKGVK